MARQRASADDEGGVADGRAIPLRRKNGLMKSVGVDRDACRPFDMCSILGRSKHRKCFPDCFCSL